MVPQPRPSSAVKLLPAAGDSSMASSKQAWTKPCVIALNVGDTQKLYSFEETSFGGGTSYGPS